MENSLISTTQISNSDTNDQSETVPELLPATNQMETVPELQPITVPELQPITVQTETPVDRPPTLTQPEQRELFAGLFEYIGELHTAANKTDLADFTKDLRNKRKKGIVLLHYNDTKDMIQSVKLKKFVYEWIPENEAKKFKHIGINKALMAMNPRNDCILASSLKMGAHHFHMNCYKFANIESG
jgi:hypothetical protein